MSESTTRTEIQNAVDELGIEAIARAIGVPRAVLQAYLKGDADHARLIEHRAVPTWSAPRPGTRLSIADLHQLGDVGLPVPARRARVPCGASTDALP